ncbi:Metallo-dependent phosphatase-like protein [Coniella lustricola]|uniref:Metallo-dependent phosphatase-like protein n=1 Tax=Coniella lustricola TaxID=2025994 RepID=A0A2T3ALA5_9PEZI|nr:Metallo-dependent phosphatase-like protein [Coniella lustricola]
MKPQIPLVLSAVSAGAAEAGPPGDASYVVPTAFPTTVYSSYYVKPGPTQEPQPAIYDPVLNITFPLNLTDPSTIPTTDPDPVLYPEPVASLTETAAAAVISASTAQILEIIDANNTGLTDSCSKCIAALSVGQLVAKLAPSYLPDAMVQLCQTIGFSTNATCQTTYEASAFGAVWTQVLANADVEGLDGRYICASLSTSLCSAPPVVPVKAIFPKEKPADVSVPVRSGKTVKVLHLSDMHLDPRYEYGSEGNCTTSPCCRPTTPSTNGTMPVIELAAPLYGYYKCDSPYYLALAAVQSIGPLTGTSLEEPLAMTFYTGDMVTHVPNQGQLSHAFVEDVEDSVLQMLKAYIGGPIYVALGNHDSSPENNDAPHAIDNNGPLGEQFSWNYDHVSQLWEHYGWINSSTQAQAAVHYGAYAVTHPLGVRIITLNTDFYYKSNYYSFLHAADPDYSGIFSFLINELQQAEDAGQRAYVMGHVLTGWDGSNPMPNGADYFYQIVERYSPHVIAGVFFGHTHEDQAFVYYANNGTNQTAGNALNNAWVGPSLTPLTNLNSGYRLYEVDTGSFEVMEAYTFYSDVNSFSDLDAAGSGPVWEFEYSTREVYGPGAGWAAEDPLNGTFWHRVTEAMEANRTLVELQNKFQGKSSVLSPNCTNQACQDARVCYMRSGSVGLGRQCPQGFGSVQSAFTGVNY